MREDEDTPPQPGGRLSDDRKHYGILDARECAKAKARQEGTTEAGVNARFMHLPPQICYQLL